MNRNVLSASVLLAGALLAPIGGGVPLADGALPEEVIPEDAVFPIPQTDMVIEIGGDATPSLADVLKSFEDISAHNLHISTETRMALKNTSTGLSRSVTVPAKEVYSYVGALLADSQFLIAETRRTEPRILSVYSLNSQERQLVRGHAKVVPIEEVGRYERHPAMLIETVIKLEHLDARQLANSMRMRIVDPNVEQIVQISEENLLLLARAPQVADWIRLLRTADANAIPEEVPEKTPVPPVENAR